MKGIHVVGLLLTFLINPCFADNPPAAAIASSHRLATEAGMAILSEGGNAFDAAVTVAAVLAVVEPYNSGLGGGGFWLLQDASKKRDLVIDARERAPQAATPNMFLVNGKLDPRLAKEGALAAAIPGEAAGLVYLSENFGKLPLRKTLAPAITLAKEGFQPDEAFLKAVEKHRALLQKSPVTQRLYLNTSATLKQPDLAHTLSLLADKGFSGFYAGKTAADLVSGVKRHGGIWEMSDLQKYQVVVREPLKGKYHDVEITTVPLPSAGGIGLLNALNILAEYEMDPLSEADRNHLITESLKRSFCDRFLLGDPDFIAVNIEKYTGEDHAEYWRETIQMNKATVSKNLNCGIRLGQGTQTTHYSILDQEGNAVSATLTLNSQFGSGMMPGGTGVLLNNEMDDFAADIGLPNHFSLLGSANNRVAPNKKPLSSMTPTFIQTEQGFGIVGTPGGPRIPSMTLLAILQAEKNSPVSDWVGAKRFHHQYWPDLIEFEQGAFSENLQNALRLRGHQLKETESSFGDMQAIFWNQETNKVTAAADPRGNGFAEVKELKKSIAPKPEVRERAYESL